MSPAAAPPAPARAADAPAAAVERELRQAVAADVFERLAAGFVDARRRRGLPAETAASLAEVFGGTLLLLVRVLFLLSAEARGLLPAGGAYARHGIERLRERAAALRVPGHPLSPHSGELWRELLALFDLLASGSASVGVPAYGGPFAADAAGARFLAENAVSDFFLAPALDKLSRDAAGARFDFAPLQPDDVAGVLEGVVGLRLAADERGKPVLYDPRGDRKAQPAGPPPRWVVDFAVAEAVGPALAEREAAYRDTLAEAAARRERLATALPESAARLEREVASLEDRAADALLSLRVVDPAMGSGRFLVRAAERVAARLAALLAEAPGGPLAARLAEVRAEAAAGARAQGMEPAAWSDAALLTRMVVKRCLFGVDVDPTAVQAARLALWLAAFVPGVPLPALEPHLKRGNALVGTRVLELQRAMEESPQGQFDAFGGPFRGLLRAASAIREATALADATPAAAAEGARRHAELEAAVAPHRRLLDLWVSRAFGNRLAEEVASLHADEVLEAARGGRARLGRAQAEALEAAARAAAEHRFFHWDLEFPEACVEPETATWSDDPGFDAVVGRPPAGRDEHAAALRPHLSHAFPHVYDAAADLHAYFWEQGLELVRRGGRVAFAVPDRWMRSAAGEGLRCYLAGRGEMEQLVDFRAAGARVEVDAACVLVVRRPGGARPATAETRVTVVGADAGPEPALARYAAAHAYAVPRGRFAEAPWSLERPEVQRLMDRIAAAGVPLRELLGAPVSAGVRTGLNDAFVVDAAARDRLVHADPRAADLLHPLLRTGDLERWAAEWRGAWLIAIASSEERAWPWTGAPDADAEHLFQRTFPSLHAHLKPWEERLRARHDQGRHWWELRPRPERDAHHGPRIVHPDAAAEPLFALAPAGACVLANACVWPSSDAYLLVVANSPVAWTWLWRSALHGRDHALRLTPHAVEALPVPPPPPGVAEEIGGGVERLLELKAEARAAGGELLDWLAAEYAIGPADPELLAFAELSATAFVEVVRRHRPRGAGALGPREVGMLRNAHAEVAPRLTSLQAKAAGLERRLSQLVVRAYGLTADEVELMWATAPPRMPAGR